LNIIPVWVFIVIFSRDLLIVLGWGIIHILTSSSAITPRVLGKVTTAIQMLAALAIVINISATIQSFFIWTVVALTAVSVIDYIIVGEKRLGEWS
jgi:cardiolipin synthase (CMP-forming)